MTQPATSTTRRIVGTDHPNMTPQEVLVFKAHDTDRSRSVRVRHSAFTDPTCPAGVPTREVWNVTVSPFSV